MYPAIGARVLFQQSVALFFTLANALDAGAFSFSKAFPHADIEGANTFCIPLNAFSKASCIRDAAASAADVSMA